MANTLTGLNTFTAKTLIKSAEVNSNFTTLKNATPLWHKYQVDYADFSAATTTNSVLLFSLDPLEVVLGVYTKHSEAFSGGSVTGVNLNVGYSGDAAYLLGPFDVNQGVTTTAYGVGQVFDLPSLSATTGVYAQLVATGSNLDSITAGTVTVYVLKCGAPS